MSCNAANKSFFLYILLPFPVSFKKFCNYLKLLLTSLYKFVRGSKRAHKGRALYLKGPVMGKSTLKQVVHCTSTDQKTFCIYWFAIKPQNITIINQLISIHLDVG